MEAESVLKAKDEDLRVVQNEFDAVMSERQVINETFVELCRCNSDYYARLLLLGNS